MVRYHIPKLLLMIWFKFPDEVDEFPKWRSFRRVLKGC